jgi:hypothetical protein
MSTNDLLSVEQWGLFEVALQGGADGNPFLDTEFGAAFTHESGAIRVGGFYNGDGDYRIRFMPTRQGVWRYRTRSNRRELDGQEGSFLCGAPSQGNHGPMRVADTYHFAYADGTPFRPVGTTCYVWNLQDDTLEEQTLRTLEGAPFNKLRFCVFPKRFLFNQNEPPSYPFVGDLQRDHEAPLPEFGDPPLPPPAVWDFTRFNGRHFEHLEQRILDLQRLGIEADLILFHPYDAGAWGFDQMPHEVNMRYLRYIVARLAAFRNVWWSFANEYDLMPASMMEHWEEYGRLVQELDPFDHLRSIHNCVAFYDHTKPWVTHCSVQHGDFSRMAHWRRQYGKPIVVDECGYEGDIDQPWGDLSAQEMVRRFWLGFADGGYVGHGETYWNEEEVLWWSKGGKLRGTSVERIAFLRRIIEAVPGAGLTPLRDFRLSDLTTIQELRELLETGPQEGSILTGIGLGMEAAGYSGSDYYLLYLGAHQPSWGTFNLTEGEYAIDVIDTWNMTILPNTQHATGKVRIALPAKPFHAIRIVRNP